MKRYIDADSVLESITGIAIDLGYREIEEVKRIILDFPTADVEEVKHGKFISKFVEKADWKGGLQEYYQPNSCSLCFTALNGTENYCPLCGAKMDLKED